MKRILLLAIPCFLAAGAAAQDAPRRKSGLWEISMSSPQMPAPMVSRQCVDEKTDSLGIRPTRGGSDNCSKRTVRREGKSVIVESVCQVEGSTATSRGVFTGDFATSYKGDMTTRFAPPMNGMTESKMSFQGRLTGPCAPGQKAGDVTGQGIVTGGGGSRAGRMDPEQARRMAEEMQRKYGKQ